MTVKKVWLFPAAQRQHPRDKEQVRLPAVTGALRSAPPAPTWTRSPGDGEGKWHGDSCTYETSRETVPQQAGRFMRMGLGWKTAWRPDLGSSRWRQPLPPPLRFIPRWDWEDVVPWPEDEGQEVNKGKGRETHT